MSIARKQIGHDLAPLLAKSIAKVRDQKAAARVWTDDELAAVQQAVDEELWRVAFKGAEQ